MSGHHRDYWQNDRYRRVCSCDTPYVIAKAYWAGPERYIRATVSCPNCGTGFVHVAFEGGSSEAMRLKAENAKLKKDLKEREEECRALAKVASE